MKNSQLNLFNQDDFDILAKLSTAFKNNESFDLEYKTAEKGFPQEFWKTYSAFANSMGGHIVLGVKEKGDNLIFQGLSQSQISAYKKEFWNNANNPNTISNNLLQEDDVKVIEFKGVNLLVFRIPIALRTQKPVHLTRNPFGNSYKRNYEGDYRCTNDEVRRMLADADNQLHHDSRILEGYTISDLDLETLRKYRQIFANTKSSHPWIALSDLEFLKKLGGYRKDRSSKKEGFTVAALLMFGKTESITDPECAPHFFPDFREMLSSDENIRWTDRIYPDGTWESNLFNFYIKVWPKLSSSLPKPFQLKQGVRLDENPAHIALRESFVNALIHADYTAPGNIVIQHKKDIFTFSNPGTLLVSIWQYYNGGLSECRNPNLQKMFLMIGSAEKAGSGVNKIMAGWEFAHWRRPYLMVDNQPDRIVLECPMFSIIPENTLNVLRSLFGNNVDTLGKNELTILATCQMEGEISNHRLQYLLDIHRTDITAVLQELCKDGYLVSENRGRWTTYQLSTVSDGSTHTRNNVDTPNNNVDTSASNVDTSNDNVETLIENVETSEKPKEHLQSSRTWIKREELNALILEVCKQQYKTIDEIAEKVQKDMKYLKNRIIPDLVRAGKLEKLHPKINHPNQAYKAKD